VCGLAVLTCGCGKTEERAGDQPALTGVPPTAPAGESSSEPGVVYPAAAPDAVLVTVNDKSLTRAMAMDMARDMAMRRGVPAQMVDQFLQQSGQQFEQQAVEQFINQTLVQSEAERLQIPVTTQQIDDVVAKLAERLPEGMSMEQALEAQGMDMAGLRKDIETGERGRALFESKTVLETPVTDAQVESFYGSNTAQFATEEEVEARHILVTCDENADTNAQAAAQAKAEALRTQLVGGADFAELAKSSSDCPSKENGGSLGSFGRGRMVPAFEDAAFNQATGVVSPVVKTPFGYHLIEVTQHQAAGTQTLAEASESIRENLTLQARQAMFEEYLAGLRRQATITYSADVTQPPPPPAELPRGE
jgi:peptidyl-prolyl cis-trans isomerase C